MIISFAVFYRMGFSVPQSIGASRKRNKVGSVAEPLWLPARLIARFNTANIDEAFGSEQEVLMGIILWLIVGGVIGWLASIIMRTDAQQGILLNIVVGIVGAFIGGLIFSGGSINNNSLNLTSFLVSLLGAVILLAIVNLFRRGSVR
jgi:uncharacterized membrane protein YeaQ/YmgE (transglycosylase-associated protein family)